ncbi:hypothetical protein MVEN_02118600 [Mycena venus]|uniref:Uncharacterized protein n=1 Tax=Mycena venus TaxID=2733690 RepID=A0A8H6X994_9AGAR|nr:hypothetical protein MVEN_02118600 [Mycena venus]
MPCPAPRHNEPVTSATNSITVTPRTAATSSAPTNSASTLPAGFSFERPMAKSIDPSFAQKVLNGEHDPNISVSDRFQRELYRKQNVNSVQIKWWSENGAEAQLLTVAAPAHPLFHPKDSGPIIRMVGLQNCTDYGYWDGNQWLLTDVAMKIKGNSILYMRSPGVSDCPGGPKAKRRLSDVEDSPPAVRLKSSSLRPLISPINYGGQSAISQSSDKPNSIISISSTDTDNLEVEIVAQVSSPSSSQAPTSEAVDPFPREFAQDMDGGFRAMEVLRGTVPIRFAEVFKNRWVHGTFYLHWNLWKAMVNDEEGKKTFGSCCRMRD